MAAYGLIDAVDILITSLEIRPMIVVLPQGDQGYWVNHLEHGPRWGDYVAYDVVSHVDANFRTPPLRRARAVGGLSMGGYGALQLAFNYPEIFPSVGAHSPSLRWDDGTLPFLGTGEEFAKRDPIALAATAPRVNRTEIAIDIAADDPYRSQADLLHQALEQRGVTHEYRVTPGEHAGDYWQRNAVVYLRFYDRVLYWRDSS